MITRSPRTRFVSRALVLLIGHGVMVGILGGLLEIYEPDPNGFRLRTFGLVFMFFLVSAPPILVSLIFIRSRGCTIFAAGLDALSPFVLLRTMRGGGDLNFAVFVWWLLVPAACLLLAGLERLSGPVVHSCRGSRK